MRFAVESWAPDYGSPATDDTLGESPTEVDAWVESGPDDWGPRSPASEAGDLDGVLFVDGVRRVEANVWITDADGESHQGLCASFAAGGVLCNSSANGSRGNREGNREGNGGGNAAGERESNGAGSSRASIVDPQVRHGLFCGTRDAEPIVTRHARFDLHCGLGTDPKELTLLLQDAMARLEVDVARRSHETARLVVVDGPLRQGHDDAAPQGAIALVGYIKTHSTSYGPPVVRETVARLAVGERTPLLVLGGRRPRFCWYLRLPCEVAHGWSGVVRLETPARHAVAEVVSFADRLARTLPRFASAPQKDPRAPQNLYPIGGLERELRRRLGDPALHYRALKIAAVEAR